MHKELTNFTYKVLLQLIFSINSHKKSYLASNKLAIHHKCITKQDLVILKGDKA